VPYVLLGVLTLGAGLGAGLGLSEGQVTHDPTTLCVASVGQGSDQILCSSRPGAAIRLPGAFTLPPANPACMAKAIKAAGRSIPTSEAGLKRVLRRLLSACGANSQN
jgi:hypothetical protein